MKIRNDFVTNSSSSSFVIAYKDEWDFDEATLQKYPFLNSFSRFANFILDNEDYWDTESAKIYKTKKDFDEYFIERFGWLCSEPTIENIISSDDYLKSLYNKAIDYLEKGYFIANKDVGYNDSINSIIKRLAKNNEVFVILEDEG